MKSLGRFFKRLIRANHVRALEALRDVTELELGRSTALHDVVDGVHDDNQNGRVQQEPGPPAVSGEQHIDLRGWV